MVATASAEEQQGPLHGPEPAPAILLGYRKWWLRRPTRAISRRIATPRLWTDLRKAPLRVQLLLATGAIGLGCFAPVFGASLAAFLCVDGLLAWRGLRARVIA